jgi:hypothetical protein
MHSFGYKFMLFRQRSIHTICVRYPEFSQQAIENGGNIFTRACLKRRMFALSFIIFLFLHSKKSSDLQNAFYGNFELICYGCTLTIPGCKFQPLSVLFRGLSWGISMGKCGLLILGHISLTVFISRWALWGKLFSKSTVHRNMIVFNHWQWTGLLLRETYPRNGNRLQTSGTQSVYPEYLEALWALPPLFFS